MTLKPAHNTTSSPVVIDGEGHTLGGGEWGKVDPAQPAVAAAVAAGDLTVLDQLPKGADPAIAAAVDQFVRGHGETPAEATIPTSAGSAPEPDPKAKKEA